MVEQEDLAAPATATMALAVTQEPEETPAMAEALAQVQLAEQEDLMETEDLAASQVPVEHPELMDRLDQAVQMTAPVDHPAPEALAAKEASLDPAAPLAAADQEMIQMEALILILILTPPSISRITHPSKARSPSKDGGRHRTASTVHGELSHAQTRTTRTIS